MKKLALTSLLALFAVSSANAATNYFVGGSAGLSLDDEHETLLGVAPEFGWKVNSNWDLGVMASYDYERYIDVYREYDVGAFARYKVAQFGGVSLLLKGTVMAEFDHYNSETSKAVIAEVKPMITYDLSESVTLYADLNFLRARAGYTWANDKMNHPKGWVVNAGVDSDDVMNTSDFQIGFNYNF